MNQGTPIIGSMSKTRIDKNYLTRSFATNALYGLVFFLVITSFLAWMPLNNDTFWLSMAYPWVFQEGLFPMMSHSIDAAISLGRPPIPMFSGQVYTWFQVELSRSLGIEWMFVNWLTTAIILYGIFYSTAHLIGRIVERRRDLTINLAVVLGIFALPFLVSNSSYYHDPTGTYFMFSWLCNTLPLFGFLCLRVYQRNKNDIRYLYIFLLLMLISSNASEANFISNTAILIYAIVSIRMENSSFDPWLKAKLYLVTFACLLSMGYWVERNLSANAQSGYSGVQTNLDIIAIGETFFLQLIYNLPAISFLDSDRKIRNSDIGINNLEVFTLISIVFIIVVLLWIILKVKLINFTHSEKTNSNGSTRLKNYRIEIIGFLFILCGNISTYSVSIKYQTEVPLFSSFYLGLGVFALTLSLLIYFKTIFVQPTIRNRMFNLAVLLGCLQLVLNCYISMQLQANQPFLRPAQKILSNLYVSQSEYCLAINGVRAKNYAGLGELATNVLQDAATLNKTFNNC
jgi:hypothetical protein